MNRLRGGILLMLALLTAAAGGAAERFAPHPVRYEMRRDLSIYFTNADEIVRTIRTALKRRDPYFDIEYRSNRNNMDDLAVIVRELMARAFDETGDPAEGDCLYHQYGGYDMTYTYTMDGGTYCYTLHIVPVLYTTREQEAAVEEKVKQVLADLDLPQSAGAYEKIAAVHDYLATHTAYDTVHRKNEHYHIKSTVYGALVYGRAACQGYAVTACRLLRELDVPCCVITGTLTYPDGSAEAHAWNLTAIDGQWYNLDVTMDVQDGTRTHFLCTDADLPAYTRDAQYADAEFCAQHPVAAARYPA